MRRTLSLGADFLSPQNSAPHPCSAARPGERHQRRRAVPTPHPRGTGTQIHLKGVRAMSNHFTGLSLGPPMGDQRLDLCDLYAFQSPADANRTVIILNANPNADALNPDAIYRLNIDNDGDYLNDLAFSYVFSKPQNGRQTVNVFLAKGQESRSVEAVGTKIIADGEVSFGSTPNIIKAGPYTFFAGSRSDAFFFDFDGVKNLFDTSGKRNF